MVAAVPAGVKSLQLFPRLTPYGNLAISEDIDELFILAVHTGRFNVSLHVIISVH